MRAPSDSFKLLGVILFIVFASLYLFSTHFATSGSEPLTLAKTSAMINQGLYLYANDCQSTGCLICNLVAGANSTSRPDRYNNNRFREVFGVKTEAKNSTVNTEAFTHIYDSNVWGKEGGGSGGGSDADYARVAGYVLELILLKHGLVSLLDAPCGGVSDSWTKRALADVKKTIPCFRYHGTDVVHSVIDRNKAVFAGVDWVSFSQQDLSAWNLNLISGYDAILSRDALQHLSYSSIAGVIGKYCRSDAQYLIVGSYLEHGDNRNIESGGCFNINLLQEPFSFPQPLEAYAEKGKFSVEMAASLNAASGMIDPYPTKFMLLYRLDELCRSENVIAFVSSHVDQQNQPAVPV